MRHVAEVLRAAAAVMVKLLRVVPIEFLLREVHVDLISSITLSITAAMVGFAASEV